MKYNLKTRKVKKRLLSKTVRRKGGVSNNGNYNFNNNANRNLINKNKYSRVGKGAFGSVYSPPLPCRQGFNENRWEQYDSKEYISKLTEKFGAENEVRISNIIRDNIDNYSDYFCLVDYICPIDKKYLHINTQYQNNNNTNYNNIRRYTNYEYNESEDRDTIAISKYCGISLKNILNGKSEVILNANMRWFLFDKLRYLIKGILKLNKFGVFHQDLHFGNIVFKLPKGEIEESNDYNLLLIDFGQAKYFEDFENTFISNDQRKNTLLRYKIEEIELILNQLLRPFIGRIIYSYDFAPHLNPRKNKNKNKINTEISLEEKEIHENIHKNLENIQKNITKKYLNLLDKKRETIEDKQIILKELYDFMNELFDVIPDYREYYHS